MRARKKTQDVLPRKNSINAARELFDALKAYAIPAHDVPAAIVKLNDLYHDAILSDQRHFSVRGHALLADDSGDREKMRTLLNKFANYSLTDEDMELLQELSFEEAGHICEYLQFERQAIAYAKFIRDYLLQLQDVISVKVDEADGHPARSYPSFYKHQDAPEGVKKLQKLLRNINNIHVPTELYKIFEKVFDVFLNIPPSKRRPPATAAFYESELQKLQSFGFLSPSCNDNHKFLDRHA